MSIHIKKPNINKNTLKKVGLILLTVVAVSGLGVLAANHYANHQSRVNAEQVAAEQAEATKRAEEAAKHQRLADQYEKNRLECERGAVFYNASSAFVRRTNEAVNCGPAIVE